MTTYIVEYNNTGFARYLRHYKTGSYYDALCWFKSMKYQYKYVRMRYTDGYETDIIEEYIQED